MRPSACRNCLCEPRCRTSRKAEPLQDGHNLAGLEDGRLAHRLGELKCLTTDEFGSERRLAVIQQHSNDLPEVAVQLVKCLALTVRPRKARDIPHVQPGLRVTLDNGSVVFHGEGSSTSAQYDNRKVSLTPAAQHCSLFSRPLFTSVYTTESLCSL